MGEFFGNLATFLGGALGGGIGFLVLAVVILVLLLPLVWWAKGTAPAKHSGLERFAASLDKPDEGWNDRFPEDVERKESSLNNDPSRIANQGTLRETASRPARDYPPLGEPNRTT